MAYPPLPVISFDYSSYGQSLGDATFPGTPLDNDLGSLAASLTQTIQFIEAAFRADAVLFNTSAPDSPAPPGVPVTVDGSRSSGIALVNLLTALEQVGIIVDNTVA
jgi:hypothetical protein